MVVGIHENGLSNLSKIAGTLGEACRFTRLGEHGEENRRQNGNNRNYDQQLDQLKPAIFGSRLMVRTSYRGLDGAGCD